jgi:hypothetical protein
MYADKIRNILWAWDRSKNGMEMGLEFREKNWRKQVFVVVKTCWSELEFKETDPATDA